MASYEIRWKHSATKELRKLPHTEIPRVLIEVEKLAQEPRPLGVRKLAGSEDAYRIRVGDYRVIYTVHDAVLIVEIVRIGHRKDVYR